MKWKFAIAAAAAACMFAPDVSFATSIGSVEGARAKERQGRYLNREDRDALRRYGGGDRYGGYRYYRPYGYDDDGYYGGYYGGPGISVYGPGYGVSIGF